MRLQVGQISHDKQTTKKKRFCLPRQQGPALEANDLLSREQFFPFPK